MNMSKAEVMNRMEKIARMLRRRFFVYYEPKFGYFCATPWNPSNRLSELVEP